MQLVAHRVFDDRGRLEDFAAYAASPPLGAPRRSPCLEGVELDIRRAEDGALVIRHSPLFSVAPRRGARRREIGLGEALDRLAALEAPPRVLFLDVKCVTAAGAVAAMVAEHPQAFETAFICWHRDEVAAIRAVSPAAPIYFCVAPIVSRTLGRCLPNDLYLYNSFPFVTATPRFSPKLGKGNRHNINVRLYKGFPGGRAAPEAATGVCVHHRLLTRALAAHARRAGLRLAVYGLTMADLPRIQRNGALIDAAILNPAPRRTRRSAAALDYSTSPAQA